MVMVGRLYTTMYIADGDSTAPAFSISFYLFLSVIQGPGCSRLSKLKPSLYQDNFNIETYNFVDTYPLLRLIFFFGVFRMFCWGQHRDLDIIS